RGSARSSAHVPPCRRGARWTSALGRVPSRTTFRSATLPKDRIELADARQAQAVRKANGRMRKHHQDLEGRIVQVIDGPFAGFRGEVKEVGEQTVKVGVQTFGRVTPIDLALGQIELVPENSN